MKPPKSFKKPNLKGAKIEIPRHNARITGLETTYPHVELSNAFHALWSKAVGQDDYVKSEWTAFQQMLAKKGIDL